MYNVFIIRFNRGYLFNRTLRSGIVYLARAESSWKISRSTIAHFVYSLLFNINFPKPMDQCYNKTYRANHACLFKIMIFLSFTKYKNTLLSIFSETMKPIGVGYSSRERLNLSEFGHPIQRGWPSVTDDTFGYIGYCFRWRDVDRVALIKFKEEYPSERFLKKVKFAVNKFLFYFF